MADKKLRRSDISCIRSELANGAGLSETFQKYVSAGFGDKKVADIVSSSASKDFIDKHKIFLWAFKFIFLLTYAAGAVALIREIDFDDPAAIGSSALGLALTAIQLYLIARNYFIGYLITIANYFQRFPALLKQEILLGNLENSVVLVMQIILIAASIYIFIKMFPHANWRGQAKVSGATYSFQQSNDV